MPWTWDTAAWLDLCSRDVLPLGLIQHRVQVIALNSADYTAWEWLWRCARLLAPSDPEVAAQEQSVLAEVAADSAKNYQLWNYRKRLALHRGPAYAHEASTC